MDPDRLLTDRECLILAAALYWRDAFEDSNPEVGIGPSRHTLLDEICKDLNLIASVTDKNRAIALQKSLRRS